jgi:hypothetical protein
LALGVVASGVASCGDDSSDELLPRADAAAIIDALDEVERNASQGTCQTAAQAVEDQVMPRIAALPKTVNARLRRTLSQSADKLKALAEDPDTCAPAAETPPPTTSATQTTQTTPPTQTTPTTQTDTEPPPDTDTDTNSNEGGTPPPDSPATGQSKRGD